MNRNGHIRTFSDLEIDCGEYRSGYEKLSQGETTVSATKILSLDTLAPFKEHFKGTPTPQKKIKGPHSRTPSGNVLTGQVKCIKDFLQTKTTPRKGNLLSGNCDHDNSNGETLTESPECENRENPFALSDFDHDDYGGQKKRKHVQSPESKEEIELHQEQLTQSVAATKRYKMTG